MCLACALTDAFAWIEDVEIVDTHPMGGAIKIAHSYPEGITINKEVRAVVKSLNVSPEFQLEIQYERITPDEGARRRQREQRKAHRPAGQFATAGRGNPL